MADDETVTAADFVRQQLDLEYEARQVLPYSPGECTYSKGPMRQRVYWCRTCADKDNEPAGICYSCSIQCHGSHDLLEMFQKRDFRCDCPTSRLSQKCALNRSTFAPNESNLYNHNFKGEFCQCNDQYNPETEESMMLQCIVCEDWLHDRCVAGVIPSESAFEAFICAACVEKHEWLRRYHGVEGIIANLPGTKDVEDKEVCLKRGLDADSAQSESKRTRVENSNDNDNLIGQKTLDESDKCKLATLSQSPQPQLALFLPDGFHSIFCKCKDCLPMLEKLPFLMEEEVTYSPPRSREVSPTNSEGSSYEAGQRALNTIPREKAIEGIMAYNNLKEKVTAFLRPYAANGKVVGVEDIKV